MISFPLLSRRLKLERVVAVPMLQKFAHPSCAMILAAAILASALIPAAARASHDKKPIDTAAMNRAILDGDTHDAHHEYLEAIKSYKEAEKISHDTCAACLLSAFQVEEKVGLLGQALDDAKKAEKEAGDDKAVASRAHLMRGVLLGEMAQKGSDKKLAEAIDEVRAALALEPASTDARFDLGFLLIKQERDAEGIAELQSLLASGKADAALAVKTRKIIADPRRVREAFAPDFSFVTLEGEHVSTDSIRGKVTLLDFWGTWCPPCRESVPTLIDLNKKYSGKPVEFVGVSSDSDEQAWKGFIAAHHMDWPEYIDLSNAVQAAFSVHSFPTFIVLDREGIVRYRSSGYGNETVLELRQAIDKALKEKPAPASPAAKSAPSAPKS